MLMTRFSQLLAVNKVKATKLWKIILYKFVVFCNIAFWFFKFLFSWTNNGCCKWPNVVQTRCGQSYKHFTLVNYNSRVVIWQFSSQYDSRVVIYERKIFIRLSTGHTPPEVRSYLAVGRWLYRQITSPFNNKLSCFWK